MGRARHAHGIRRAQAIVSSGPDGSARWIAPEALGDFARRRAGDGPIEIEVGHGDGAFLLERARAHADTVFIGVEMDGHYFQQLVRRADEARAANLFSVWMDGVHALAALPDRCLDAIHAYFPDPWPKKRHHRRRFFRRDSAEHAWRVLATGGVLWLATDNPDYFADILSLLEAGFEKTLFPNAWPEGAPRTRYETKWQAAGHSIRRASFQRLEGAPPQTWPQVQTSADERRAHQRARQARRNQR